MAGENTDSEYTFEVLHPPVTPAITEDVIVSLSNEIGEPWISDIKIRLNDSSEKSSNLFSVSRDVSGRIVSNTWIGWNGRQPEGKRVGMLGHVVTLNSHRRKGLATKVSELAVSDFYTQGGICLTLGVSNPSAYPLYHKIGFRPVKKGESEDEYIMLHSRNSIEPTPFLSEYFSNVEGDMTSQVLTRHNVGDIGLLFVGFPSIEVNCGDVIKLGNGLSAELDVLKLFALVDEGEMMAYVAVSNSRVVGLQVQVLGVKYSITHPLFAKAEYTK